MALLVLASDDCDLLTTSANYVLRYKVASILGEKRRAAMKVRIIYEQATDSVYVSVLQIQI